MPRIRKMRAGYLPAPRRRVNRRLREHARGGWWHQSAPIHSPMRRSEQLARIHTRPQRAELTAAQLASCHGSNDWSLQKSRSPVVLPCIPVQYTEGECDKIRGISDPSKLSAMLTAKCVLGGLATGREWRWNGPGLSEAHWHLSAKSVQRVSSENLPCAEHVAHAEHVARSRFGSQQSFLAPRGKPCRTRGGNTETVRISTLSRLRFTPESWLKTLRAFGWIRDSTSDTRSLPQDDNHARLGF